MIDITLQACDVPHYYIRCPLPHPCWCPCLTSRLNIIDLYFSEGSDLGFPLSFSYLNCLRWDFPPFTQICCAFPRARMNLIIPVQTSLWGINGSLPADWILSVSHPLDLSLSLRDWCFFTHWIGTTISSSPQELPSTEANILHFIRHVHGTYTSTSLSVIFWEYRLVSDQLSAFIFLYWSK